jgi:hypothetical protein
MGLQSSLLYRRSEGAFVALCLCVRGNHCRSGDKSFLPGFAGTPLPYILLFPAIALSAWYCGVGPSACASLLALAGLRYWFVTPLHSFRVPDSTQVICMLAFLFASAGVIALGESRRRDNENLKKERVELEDRVRERTAELGTANESLRTSPPVCCNRRMRRGAAWPANCMIASANCWWD